MYTFNYRMPQSNFCFCHCYKWWQDIAFKLDTLNQHLTLAHLKFRFLYNPFCYYVKLPYLTWLTFTHDVFWVLSDGLYTTNYWSFSFVVNSNFTFSSLFYGRNYGACSKAPESEWYDCLVWLYSKVMMVMHTHLGGSCYPIYVFCTAVVFKMDLLPCAEIRWNNHNI